MKNILLNNAAYDLKFLLNRGYRKKGALNFVSNKYLLNKDERNYFRVLDFLCFGKLLEGCFGVVAGCCDESC